MIQFGSRKRKQDNEEETTEKKKPKVTTDESNKNSPSSSKQKSNKKQNEEKATTGKSRTSVIKQLFSKKTTDFTPEASTSKRTSLPSKKRYNKLKYFSFKLNFSI